MSTNRSEFGIIVAPAAQQTLTCGERIAGCQREKVSAGLRQLHPNAKTLPSCHSERSEESQSCRVMRLKRQRLFALLRVTGARGVAVQ